MELNDIRQSLTAFVRDEFDSNCTLGSVSESDGHAGLTFLFDVENSNKPLARYVVKVPPAGVKLKGNTDVMRQAPLLNSLHKAGLPVPAVPYAFHESPWFDRPFIVMDRLPGKVFFVWEPDQSFDRSGPRAEGIWRQCIEQLSAFHHFDWQQNLGDWETAEPLLDNVQRWQKIYRHALDPSWISMAETVQNTLLDHIPQDYDTGLFHGDFQPGNMLYEDHEFVAVIDWELAGISAQLLDLGWLLMVSDTNNWIDDYSPISPLPATEVLAIYEHGMGKRAEDAIWFQAFAGFRLASIACLNHKLHVTGKRPEPAWEQLGKCIEPMLTTAAKLMGQYT